MLPLLVECVPTGGGLMLTTNSPSSTEGNPRSFFMVAGESLLGASESTFFDAGYKYSLPSPVSRSDVRSIVSSVMDTLGISKGDGAPSFNDCLVVEPGLEVEVPAVVACSDANVLHSSISKVCHCY